MNMVSWSLLYYLLLTCIGDGYGILCYHCHQTTRECNNGAVNSLHQKNCTEGRCAVMKYETTISGRKVLATLRDCHSYTKPEFVRTVSPDMTNPAKIIIFQNCSIPLCNGANSQRFWGSTCAIVIIIVFLYVNVFKLY